MFWEGLGSEVAPLNYSFGEGLGKMDYSLLQNIGTRSSCNEIRAANGDGVEGRAAHPAGRVCAALGGLGAFLQLGMFCVGLIPSPVPGWD